MVVSSRVKVSHGVAAVEGNVLDRSGRQQLQESQLVVIGLIGDLMREGER